MAVKALPSQDTLLQLLRYEPDTGKLFWLARSPSLFSATTKHTADHQAARWNSRLAGKEAFTARNVGYRYGAVDGRLYLAHRVIWKMVHGNDPKQIDHINGIRSDNRLENLRSVEEVENHKNQQLHAHNTSGVCGVSFDRSRGKWEAHVTVGNRKQHLGRFASIEEAVAVRKQAEANLGFHPNHGRLAHH